MQVGGPWVQGAISPPQSAGPCARPRGARFPAFCSAAVVLPLVSLSPLNCRVNNSNRNLERIGRAQAGREAGAGLGARPSAMTPSPPVAPHLPAACPPPSFRLSLLSPSPPPPKHFAFADFQHLRLLCGRRPLITAARRMISAANLSPPIFL